MIFNKNYIIIVYVKKYKLLNKFLRLKLSKWKEYIDIWNLIFIDGL